jgi:hypothetical protein
VSDQGKRSSAATRRAGKRSSTQRRLNRAQRRAMEVRAAESARAPAANPVTGGVAVDSREYRTPAERRPQRRPAPTAVLALSRAAEYAYIRADLRRLFITAGSLLALMVALLFIVD